MTNTELTRYRGIRQLTLITAVVNVVLAVLKIVFGRLGHSHGLFADGVHSFADLISDFIVLVAAKFGSMTPDQKHPYGRGKIETLGTAILSLVLVGVGIGIAIDAMGHFMHKGSVPIPDAIVLWVSAFSILVNELIFQWTKHFAIKIESKLLLANAWHHRSDALSSVVVLVGASGSILGWPYCDAIAAVFVAVMLLHMSWVLVWHSLRELIDTAVDPKTLDEIKTHIRAVPGVVQLHECRTRYMRSQIMVDVHVIVGSRLSVSEGHHVAQNVDRCLRATMPAVVDVTVHIDPEDDELYPPSIGLPNRAALLAILDPVLADCPGYRQKQLTLHYLAGKLQLDFVLPLSVLDKLEPQKVEQCYHVAYDAYPDIEHIRLSYCVDSALR